MKPRKLTLEDFLDTRAGQSKKAARKDFEHYRQTGEVIRPPKHKKDNN